MAKKYNNQIKAGSGFSLSGEYPIDDRTVVAASADLDTLVSSFAVYEGMQVYVIADKKTYEYKNTGTELECKLEWKAIAYGEDLAAEVSRASNAEQALSNAIAAIKTTDADITLSETIWTDKTIGYIAGTTSSPKIVANQGESLKKMFTNIFGTVTDDTSNLVTNPYISNVSIGNSSYEYGTNIDSVSVTVTPVAGSYKYGPSSTGSSWSGNYTLSGTGFTTKNNSTADTQTVSLSNTFTVGTSDALTLTASRAYTAATATALSKMGSATTQKIAAGTATNDGTFNPTVMKYVYYAVTQNTTTPTSWTKYGSGTTSTTDLSITADAGKYVWIATTGNYSNFYTFNEVSGKYNTDATPTTKLSSQTITNSQNASASGYYIYRITNAKALGGTVKYKLG